MGYRNYFGRINNKVVKEIENLSIEELTEWVKKIDEKYIDDSFIDWNAFLKKDCFEFGKLYYEDTIDLINNTGEKLFKNNETNEHFEDHSFYVVGKDGILKAIEIYTAKIKSYYEDLLIDDDCTKEDKLNQHVKEKLRWLKYKCDLSDDKDIVSCSWLFEDGIFNLVAVLKNTDWENETIVFYGY